MMVIQLSVVTYQCGLSHTYTYWNSWVPYHVCMPVANTIVCVVILAQSPQVTRILPNSSPVGRRFIAHRIRFAGFDDLECEAFLLDAACYLS